MDRARIRVDFNDVTPVLSRTDVAVDSDGNLIKLAEGLPVYCYETDHDWYGRDDNLLADGTATWLDAYGYGPAWRIRFDGRGIRHESDEPGFVVDELPPAVIRVEMSRRSDGDEAPPRMILTMLASQMAPAASGPHFCLACDSDWRTGMVVMPVPPPSAINVGRDGRGAMLATSSNANNSGGSSRAPGLLAARRRAVSTKSSTNAATKGADAPAPAPVAPHSSKYSALMPNPQSRTASRVGR